MGLLATGYDRLPGPGLGDVVGRIGQWDYCTIGDEDNTIVVV